MSQPFIGEIRMFGGNFAPVGWAFCDGQLMPISENDALFTLIGTTFGGDGENTFAMPDLRGRLPMHQGNGYVLGQMGGVESVTLTTNQIPAHTHAAQANSAIGSQSTPANGVWAAAPTSRYSSSAPNLAMKNSLVAPAGGSQPHENMMPFLTVSFIISLFGIFPSQN